MSSPADWKSNRNEKGGITSDLVTRAAEGDRSAMEAVLAAHADYVRQLLRKLLGSGADLDDLQQEVFVRIVTSLRGYRGESELSSWVRSITVHVARTHLRRGAKRRSERDHEVDAGEERDRRSGTDDQVDAQRQLARMRDALERLSPNHRLAFTLKIMGHSVDEIAEMMGSANSTTRLRLYYARKAFAKALVDEEKK